LVLLKSNELEPRLNVSKSPLDRVFW